MFWKKEPALEVIIGPESSIKGDLDTKGIVRIDGTIEGCIHADWLIVGRTGAVIGDVVLRGIVVDGMVRGNIDSREIIEIKPKGVVEGDVFTTRLIVSEGAFFDGRSNMQKLANTDNKDILFFEQKVKKSL
jgi:cytoskeletal protein CcmA (bactofilin family)